MAVHQRDEFNDLKEISSLADNLKIITILITEILCTVVINYDILH